MSDQVWEVDGEVAEIQFQLVQQVKAARKLLGLLQLEDMKGVDVLFKGLFDNVEAEAGKLERIMARERKASARRAGKRGLENDMQERED